MFTTLHQLRQSKPTLVATIAYWSAIENMNSDRGFMGVLS